MCASLCIICNGWTRHERAREDDEESLAAQPASPCTIIPEQAAIQHELHLNCAGRYLHPSLSKCGVALELAHSMMRCDVPP